MDQLKTDVLLLTGKEDKNQLLDAVAESWKDYVEKDPRKNSPDRFSRYRYEKGRFYDLINQEEVRPDEVGQAGVVVISSRDDFESFFNSMICRFSHLFIEAGLGWSKPVMSFEGYQVAEELITTFYRDRLVQLKFLSNYSQDEILHVLKDKPVAIAESFPHINLFESPGESEKSVLDPALLFAEYSSIHFELIKSLSLTQQGQLSSKRHAYAHDHNNLKKLVLKDIDAAKEAFNASLDDLVILQEISDIKIRLLRKEVEIAETADELLSISESILKSIDSAIGKVMTAEAGRPVEKSNFRVCIVEDDHRFLKLFTGVFSELFRRVYPAPDEIDRYDITGIKQNIEELAGDYDIFILDLMYLEGKKWLPFNGLEIYNTIRVNNPHAVIRIITNLPRDIISRISEKMVHEKQLTEKIPMSHIFSKSKGDDVLRFSIFDRADEIVRECEEKQQNKNLNLPVPTVGIFGDRFVGVREHIRRMMIEEPDVYEGLVSQAFSNFRKFELDELELSTPDWNQGKLPGMNTFTGNWREATLRSALPNIMTHRLMVLSSMNPETNILSLNDYVSRVEGLVSFQNFDSTNYLTTRLGLSKKNTLDGRIQILRENLFMHEVEYLKKRSNYNHSMLLSDISDDLADWFLRFLISPDGNIAVYHYLARKNNSFNHPYYQTIEEKDIPDESDVKSNMLTLGYLLEVISLLAEHAGHKSVRNAIKVAEDLLDYMKATKIPKEVDEAIGRMLTEIE